MACIQKIKTPVMDQSFQVMESSRRAKRSVFWGSVNAAVFAVLMYDLSYTCPDYSPTVYIIEAIATFFIGVNLTYYIYGFIFNTLNKKTVLVTPEQKRLLGIRGKNSNFQIKTPEAKTPVGVKNVSVLEDMFSNTPMNLSADSWRSASVMSSFLADGVSSMNYSVSSPSWTYYPGSTSPLGTSGLSPQTKTENSIRSLCDQSKYSNVSSVSSIENEESLKRFLQEYEEKSLNLGNSADQSNLSMSPFWRNSFNASKYDVSQGNTTGRFTYQLATPVISQKSSPAREADDFGSPSSQRQTLDVWTRASVNTSDLISWNANLRKWLSQTILERLVKEIQSIDETFQRHGLSDMKVGAVGLERLKKTAQTVQVVQNIPTLPHLLPFLELTANQEYLVNRIKELASGGCMSDFRWNRGGTFNGKEWEEHLPTDSALIMHLLATYLDSQLPPIPQNPDGKPFTSQYFVKSPERPPKSKNAIIIFESQVNPPHYMLYVGEEKYELPKGRNNFLHTVLLFIHQVKLKEHGMLGRVNLGPSGINVLWVIEN